MRFNTHEFAAFDCFMLGREGAEADYSEAVLRRAKAWFAACDEGQAQQAPVHIMAGLPGAFDRYDVPGLRADARSL